MIEIKPNEFQALVNMTHINTYSNFKLNKGGGWEFLPIYALLLYYSVN